MDEILLGRFKGDEPDDDLAPKRRAAKGHTFYRTKTEHVAVDVDNALMGPFIAGAGLRKFQVPENWREDMSGCLDWPVLIPASDQGPDAWCFANWCDSDAGRIVNQREPDVHNHGLHNDVTGAALDSGHGTFLFALCVCMNVHFLPFREGKYGRMIMNQAEDLQANHDEKEVCFQHYFSSIADEKSLGSDAYSGEVGERATWFEFINSTSFWLFQQKVGMCRWGQIFQRLPTFVKDWSSMLALITRLCVDEKFMDKKVFDDILGDIAACDAAGSKFNRNTKESSAEELRELRKACRHALNFTVHFLSSHLNKMTARVLSCLGQAVWYNYSDQAKTLIGSAANGTWALLQLKGEVWVPLRQTFQFLQTASKLELIGIDTECRAKPESTGLAKEMYSKCQLAASTAGRFCQAVVRKRVWRLAFLILGWPYRFALFLDADAAVRQQALDDLKRDAEAYEDAKRLNTTFYNKMLVRSPMGKPVVAMILEPLKANGYNLTAAITAKVDLLNKGFKQSRLIEKGFCKARKLETGAASKEIGEMRLMAGLVETGLLNEEFKYKTHDLKTLPYKRNGTIAPERFRPRRSTCSVDVSSIRGTKRKAPFPSPGPTGWARGFFELDFLGQAYLHDRHAEQEEHQWRLALFPKDEALIVSFCAEPGIDSPWFLLLGPTDAALLTWPLQRAWVSDDAVAFNVCQGCAYAMPQYLFGQDICMRTCEWTCPGVQHHGYLAPSAVTLFHNAKLRLVAIDKGPEPWRTTLAKHAFFKATHQQLVKLGLNDGVPGITKKTPLHEVLEIEIRWWVVGITDLDLYNIIWLRKPPTTDGEGLLDIPEMMDMVDGADRDQLEKVQQKRAKERVREAAFWTRMRPLRDRCMAHFKAQEEAMACEARARGLAAAPDDAQLTEENAVPARLPRTPRRFQREVAAPLAAGRHQPQLGRARLPRSLDYDFAYCVEDLHGVQRPGMQDPWHLPRRGGLASGSGRSACSRPRASRARRSSGRPWRSPGRACQGRGCQGRCRASGGTRGGGGRRRASGGGSERGQP